MKKSVFVSAMVLALALAFTATVFATQPTYGAGTWDTVMPLPDEPGISYMVYGPFEGLIIQPEKPGRAQKGMFSGIVDGREGTCLMNVVTLNNAGVGSGSVLQCDGELAGLHATFTISLDDPINFTGSYETWYHFDP